MSIVPTYPDFGSQSCQGVYVIDKNVKEAVFMSSHMSSSSEGELYSNRKFCAWYIDAAEGQVIQLKFDYFFTECFWDSVTVFDGPDHTYPILGKLCGNRDADYGYADIIISSGNYLTIFFQSDSDLNGRGFRALSRQIAPIPIASTAFTSRMFHSSVYDKHLDIVYNTFGLANGGIPQNDMILYFPQNDTFFKKRGWIDSPPARYSHFSAILDSRLIIFGGSTLTIENFGADALNDVWSYDTIGDVWTKLKAYGSIPPGLEDPAITIAEHKYSKILYVFGGKFRSRDGISISRTLFSYDLDTGIWTILAKAPVQVWGASIIYHEETQTLHLLGGFMNSHNPSFSRQYPSYIYSIQSGIWNAVTLRIPEYSQIYSTAQYIGQDYGVIFGGMFTPNAPKQAPLQDCFSSLISIYDVACESFIYYPTQDSYKRAGHSMIIRNDTILVIGGSDGIFRDSVLTIPIPRLNQTTDERNQCKTQNYCKDFSSCHNCLSKPYCGWCPDKCALNDFLIINTTNTTVGTCADQRPIQNSDFTCPISDFAQLDRPIFHVLNHLNNQADFEVYVDAPNYDLVAVISSISPPQTTLIISLPYINISTRNLPGGNGILVPAEDLRRISGMYHFRVTSYIRSNSKTLDYSPISFSIKFTTYTPEWMPNEPDAVWENLDIISFALVFAISFLLSVVMVVLIVRARRRLVNMQDWQRRTEYADEISLYRPELFSVVMHIATSQSKCLKRESQLNFDFGNSQTSLSLKKSNDQSGWFPRLIRKLTMSQLEVSGNSQTQWPLSVERFPLRNCIEQRNEIIGVSYLVVNPGFERSVHSGSLPNMPIGTSLHLHKPPYNSRFSSLLSIGTIKPRSWRSYIPNYFQNNSS